MSDATQRRIVENVIQHVGPPPPRHLLVLHGGKAAAGKLLDERVVFPDVEIAGENRWPIGCRQALGDKIATKPACAGPYKFVERVAQERIVLERFDRYWNPTPYTIDRVTYTPVPEVPEEVRERYQVLLEVLAGKETVSGGARRLHLSRNYFQSLLHRGLEGLLEGLSPKPSGRSQRK